MKQLYIIGLIACLATGYLLRGFVISDGLEESEQIIAKLREENAFTLGVIATHEEYIKSQAKKISRDSVVLLQLESDLSQKAKVIYKPVFQKLTTATEAQAYLDEFVSREREQ